MLSRLSPLQHGPRLHVAPSARVAVVGNETIAARPASRSTDVLGPPRDTRLRAGPSVRRGSRRAVRTEQTHDDGNSPLREHLALAERGQGPGELRGTPSARGSANRGARPPAGGPSGIDEPVGLGPPRPILSARAC